MTGKGAWSARLASAGIALVLLLLIFRDDLLSRSSDQMFQNAQAKQHEGAIVIAAIEEGSLSIRDMRPLILQAASRRPDNSHALTLMPGGRIIVGMERNASYWFASTLNHLAPYVLFQAVPPARLAIPTKSFDSQSVDSAPHQLAPGEALTHLLMPVAADGTLTLTRWDPRRPWSEERPRLEAIVSTCGAEATTIEASWNDKMLTLRAGRCTLSVDAPSDAFALALGAGTGIELGSDAASWTGWGRIRPATLAILIAAAIVLLAWPGGLRTASLLLAILLLNTFQPLWAAMVLSLLVTVALMVVAFRVLRRMPQPARTATVLVATLGLTAGFLPWHPDEEAEPPAPVTGAHPGCVVIGYSTVHGEGLGTGPERDAGGAFHGMASSCGVCSGSVHVQGIPGARLDDMVRLVADSPAISKGARVIFFGGSNDDFMWSGGTLNNLFSRLFPLRQFDAMTFEDWRRTLDRCAVRSASGLDEQTRAISRLSQEVSSRGASLLFVHDFLAYDLEHPRSKARARMLSARRAAVEDAGHRFVDLHQELGNRIPALWFVDFIQPSWVGHQDIGPILCRALEGEDGPR